MKFTGWIIKKLGGITKADQEELRKNYEAWAVKHLTGKNGEITPDSYMYNPYDGDDIVIIRSQISIMNGKVKGVKIAPWCKEVSCIGLHALEERGN